MNEEKKSLWKEFNQFALKGNVVELALAVVIGGAFGKIVTSLVNDVVMPLVNPLIPGGDWRNLQVGPGVRLGLFIGSMFDFIIISLVLFLFVRAFSVRNKSI